jgi:hypothetical protein
MPFRAPLKGGIGCHCRTAITGLKQALHLACRQAHASGPHCRNRCRSRPRFSGQRPTTLRNPGRCIMWNLLAILFFAAGFLFWPLFLVAVLCFWLGRARSISKRIDRTNVLLSYNPVIADALEKERRDKLRRNIFAWVLVALFVAFSMIHNANEPQQENPPQQLIREIVPDTSTRPGALSVPAPQPKALPVRPEQDTRRVSEATQAPAPAPVPAPAAPPTPVLHVPPKEIRAHAHPEWKPLKEGSREFREIQESCSTFPAAQVSECWYHDAPIYQIPPMLS